jgi:hypothetical protein
MKKLRRILMAMAVPFGGLITLTQLGGSPIYKGSDTGFDARPADQVSSKLALSTDSGDLHCLVKLRLPLRSQSFSASLSGGTPLAVYQENVQDGNQWVAISADGPKREEKFHWPSGATLYLTTTNGISVVPSDWRVYLADQAYDSRDRAIWRKVAVVFSLVFLSLSLTGGILEGLARANEEPRVSFTHERCLNELIMGTEGANQAETEWMRSILRKVLLETVPVADALRPIPLGYVEKMKLWFATRDQFRSRLKKLITDLNIDLSYLQ